MRDDFIRDLFQKLDEALDENFPEFDSPKRKKQQIYPNIQTSVCQSQKCEKYHKLAEGFCNIHCIMDEKSLRMIAAHQKSRTKK